MISICCQLTKKKIKPPLPCSVTRTFEEEETYVIVYWFHGTKVVLNWRVVTAIKGLHCLATVGILVDCKRTLRVSCCFKAFRTIFLSILKKKEIESNPFINSFPPSTKNISKKQSCYPVNSFTRPTHVRLSRIVENNSYTMMTLQEYNVYCM